MGATTLAAYPQLPGCSSGLSACARAGCWHRAFHSFQRMRPLDEAGETMSTVIYCDAGISWNFRVSLEIWGWLALLQPFFKPLHAFQMWWKELEGLRIWERLVTTRLGRIILLIFHLFFPTRHPHLIPYLQVSFMMPCYRMALSWSLWQDSEIVWFVLIHTEVKLRYTTQIQTYIYRHT